MQVTQFLFKTYFDAMNVERDSVAMQCDRCSVFSRMEFCPKNCKVSRFTDKFSALVGYGVG